MAEPDLAAARGKVLRLTDKGQRAQQRYRRLLATTEVSWRATYGADAVDDLRAALRRVVGNGTLASSPPARGLEPHPDGS